MTLRLRLVAAGAAIGLLAGCGGSGTSTQGASSTTSGPSGSSQAGEPTYTVGVITDLTGPASNVARFTELGVKAGVGRAAESGYHIKYILVDDATNPTQALSAAQQLVEQDHVFAVIATSAVLFAAAPYLHSKGIPVIGAAYDGSEWITNDNMFSIFGYQDYAKVETTTGLMLKLLGATNLGTIGYSISPSSAETAKSYAVSAQLAGLKAGYVDANVPFGSTNVGPLVLAMKAAKIDAFYPLTETSTGLAAIVGLRQQGVDLKAAFLPEEEGDLLASGPATEAQAKGVYMGYDYEPVQMDTPATRTFQAALAKYAGVTTDPTANEYLGYLSIDALVDGLKAAGPHPTQASLIQAMLGMTHYNAAGLVGSHSISFAMAGRGSVTGADNCGYLVLWNGAQFKLVPGADPICGTTVPGKTVSAS